MFAPSDEDRPLCASDELSADRTEHRRAHRPAVAASEHHKVREESLGLDGDRGQGGSAQRAVLDGNARGELRRKPLCGPLDALLELGEKNQVGEWTEEAEMCVPHGEQTDPRAHRPGKAGNGVESGLRLLGAVVCDQDARGPHAKSVPDRREAE